VEWNVPCVQAKIYWDQGDYAHVERIFRASVELCSEHDTWRLNVAHTLFMQENKFKARHTPAGHRIMYTTQESAGFYEQAVKKRYDHILDVSAVVLANLCVCYIMTNQNEEAEELMRKVEREEERAAYESYAWLGGRVTEGGLAFQCVATNILTDHAYNPGNTTPTQHGNFICVS
jgi:hypothetical protein